MEEILSETCPVACSFRRCWTAGYYSQEFG